MGWEVRSGLRGAAETLPVAGKVPCSLEGCLAGAWATSLPACERSALGELGEPSPLGGAGESAPLGDVGDVLFLGAATGPEALTLRAGSGPVSLATLSGSEFLGRTDEPEVLGGTDAPEVLGGTDAVRGLDVACLFFVAPLALAAGGEDGDDALACVTPGVLLRAVSPSPGLVSEPDGEGGGRPLSVVIRDSWCQCPVPSARHSNR